MSLLDIFGANGGSDTEDESGSSLPGPLDSLANSISSSVAGAVDRFINPPAQNSAPAPDLNRAAANPGASQVTRPRMGVSPVLLVGGAALGYLLLKKRF